MELSDRATWPARAKLWVRPIRSIVGITFRNKDCKEQGLDLAWPYQAINDKGVLCDIRGTTDRFSPNLEVLESTWVHLLQSYLKAQA